MTSYRLPPASGPADWEKSLANIIQRTNSNLSNMNRYSSASGPGSNPTPSRYSVAPPACSGVRSPVVSNPSRSYSNQNLPPTTSNPQTNGAKGNDQPSNSQSSSNSAEKIEANVMKHVRQLISDKFVIVERSVDSLRQQIVGLSSEVSRVSAEVGTMSRSMNAQETMVESLRHDMNSRRTMLAKMESWVADEETWRSTMDSKVALISNDVKSLDSVVSSQQSAISARASQAEMKVALDGAHLTATSAVAAAMSPVQTHLERELEAIRRHVAALRIGRGKEDISNMSSAEVDRALTAEQPSELLVKSVVQSKMAELQEKLEDKVTAHLIQNLKVEQNNSQQALSKLIPVEVERVFKESGFGSSVSSIQTKLEEKERMAQKAVEGELQKFMSTIESNRSSVDDVKKQFAELEKSQQLSVRSVERSVEDSRSASESRAEDIRDRMRELERNVRQTEQKVHDDTLHIQKDMASVVQEASGEWRTEMAEFTKRLSVNESTVANYAANDDKTLTAIKNFGNRMEIFEGVNRDVMKRVVDTTDIDHRLTSVEGTSTALNDRVTTVEGRVSEFKNSSASEIQTNASRVNASIAEIKKDFIEFQKSLEEGKKESSTGVAGVAGGLEGVKKDVDVITEKLGKNEIEIERLGGRMEDVEKAPAKNTEAKEGSRGDAETAAAKGPSKIEVVELKKKTAELENKIQMLQSSFASIEDTHVGVKQEIAKIGVLANTATEKTEGLHRRVEGVASKQVREEEERGRKEEGKKKWEEKQGEKVEKVEKKDPERGLKKGDKKKVEMKAKAAPAPAKKSPAKSSPASVAVPSPLSGSKKTVKEESDSDDSDEDDSDISLSSDSEEEEEEKEEMKEKIDKVKKGNNEPPKGEPPKKGKSPTKAKAAAEKQKLAVETTPTRKKASDTPSSVRTDGTDDSFAKETPPVTPVKTHSGKPYTPKRTPSVEEMHAAPTALSDSESDGHNHEDTESEEEDDDDDDDNTSRSFIRSPKEQKKGKK